MSKLGNYISVQNGYAFKSKDFIKNLSGMPVIKIGNVTGGSFIDLSSYDTISEEIARKVKSFQTKDDDILIAMTGANVGKVSRIAKGTQPCLINQRVGRFILKEDCPYSSDFIYYLVSSNKSFQYFSNTADGAAQPNISGKLIEDLEFPDISPKSANKAGKYLKVLDEKIQLNTQINQTLEQIAQALFKSWFVDFDPVRAKVQALSDGLSLEQAELAAMQAISGKTPEELTALSQAQPERYAELAETAKAFPCEMVEVDGVEVPKGWKTIPFKDFIKEKKEKVGNLKNIPEYSVTNNGIIPRSQKFNKQLSKNPEKNKLLHKTDLVFGMSREILNWGIMVDDIGSVSSAYHVYSIDKNVINHIYLKMMMMNKFQYFNELIRPSSREGQSFDKELLKEKTVTVPSNFLLDHFLYKLELLNNQINTIKKETKTLISIRDTLLPELLNGEI